MTTTDQEKLSTRKIDPEWLRLPDAVKFSGLSRSLLYECFDIAGGPIKTRSIRRRNQLRGVRLVNVDSIRSYIENGGEA